MTQLVSCRKIFSLAALVAVGCVFASGAFAQTPVPASIQLLIPIGKYHVDVMQIVYPKELLTVLQKLKVAATAHPEEFQALLRRRGSHGPLPYDPVLGITRAEYIQLNTLKPTSQRIGTAELEIGSKAGQRTLKGTASISSLNGVAIELNKGIVSTPYGDIQKYNTVKATPGQTVTGPWDGISWTFNPGGRAGQFPGHADPRGVLEFNLGKIRSNGKTFLAFRYESVEHNTLKENVFIMIQFDVAHPHP